MDFQKLSRIVFRFKRQISGVFYNFFRRAVQMILRFCD